MNTEPTKNTEGDTPKLAVWASGTGFRVRLRLCLANKTGDRLESLSHWGALIALFLDLGLVYQHDRDVVFDRVHALALRSFQALLIGRELDGLFVGGADQDLKELFADRHTSILP